jgi:two-component system osmolarity sensor histidine kinase EnvZ
MSHKLRKISSSLLLRSFYLISIPIVLIQIIGIVIFFELHWDLVLKKLSNNIVNNIELFINEYNHYEEVPYNSLQTLELVLIKNNDLKIYKNSNNYFLKKRMTQALSRIKYSTEFKIYNEKYFIIKIDKNGHIFNFLIKKDELETKTITGFFLWILLCSIILSLISYFFIKNQIRPLKRLGIITRSFGRGIETPDIRPTGSTEIRGLIKDFNYMKNNINQTINSQKNMLAGISHDLRTPLTRINLMIDNLSDKQIKLDIQSNINEMNLMIEHYIDFIKNEKDETTIEVQSNIFIKEIIQKYKNISISKNEQKNINIKKNQIYRSIQNVIENSQKFANKVFINSYFEKNYWVIKIEDDGPGTDLNPEDLVKPFFKGKNQLNQGSGLGLSIAKKIVDINNGDIQFNKSSHGGLMVILKFQILLK